MKQDEIKDVLQKHKLWIDTHGKEGERAKLNYVDLSYVDLSYADLRYAILSYANLNGANLSYADLRYADLRYADLRHAILNGTNLSGANMDYSVWPLWGGSLNAKIDNKIAIQLLYHLLSCVVCSSDVDNNVKDILLQKQIIDLTNKFYHAEECGRIKERENEARRNNRKYQQF